MMKEKTINWFGEKTKGGYEATKDMTKMTGTAINAMLGVTMIGVTASLANKAFAK